MTNPVPFVSKTLFILFLFMSISFNFSAQTDRITIIEQKLDSLSKSYPGLNAKIQFTINGASIQEFIRTIALNNSLNVTVDPSLNKKVTNNFADVRVADVFLFLCKNYDLHIEFTGPIMSFVPYIPPVTPVKTIVHRVNITYDPVTKLLVMDLKNDTLSVVLKELTRQTGKNIVFAPDLTSKTVNGYYQSLTIDKALENLSFTNDLTVSTADGETFFIERKEKTVNNNTNNNTFPKNGLQNNNNNQNGIGITSKDGLLEIQANNVPIKDLLDAASKELKLNYYLFSELKGNSSLNIKESTFDDFLKNLFNGTEYTFRKDNGVYLIGDRSLEGLRSSKLVQLKYRSADKITEFIPAELKKGLDIKPFPDMNGFIVSGSQPRIEELEDFMRQIDVVVPVVAIEVMIVDINNSKTVSTGIQAGIGTPPPSNNTVFPGIDLTLNSGVINNIISGINGFASINLGNVTPNFYLKIKALEEQGYLKLRSTPQLATLNGNEAKLSIGKTEYYLEQTNNVVGQQNPNFIITNQYKPVNADLSVVITPMVSQDEQITLNISVKQSSFTARISNTAPPGTITRDFKSTVRVKNGEMVMLGGLEEDSSNDSGSGTPFLSRIPVIKWFFSSRTKIKSDNKLTIFIKPIVIY